MIKHYDQNQIGEEGIYFLFQLPGHPSLREVRADWRNTGYWLAPLTCLSYTTKSHLPREWHCPQWAASSLSISCRETVLQTCAQANLMEAILQVRVFLPRGRGFESSWQTLTMTCVVSSCMSRCVWVLLPVWTLESSGPHVFFFFCSFLHYFLRQVLSLNLKLTYWLDWLSSKPLISWSVAPLLFCLSLFIFLSYPSLHDPIQSGLCQISLAIFPLISMIKPSLQPYLEVVMS